MTLISPKMTELYDTVKYREGNTLIRLNSIKRGAACYHIKLNLGRREVTRSSRYLR